MIDSPGAEVSSEAAEVPAQGQTPHDLALPAPAELQSGAGGEGEGYHS